MSNQHMLLWLESPLQSWGNDSKFYRRDTLSFPTKSGVIGLLLCALGASGEQKELLSKISHLSHTVISFKRSVEQKEEKASLLLRDFHMIGSGYDESDGWQSLLIPKTNEGKKPNGGGAKLSHRYYLQDAAFAVIVELPESMVEIMATALQNPVWDLYLGRKNCVPTDFIYRGIFISLEDAITVSLEIGAQKSRIEDFRVLEGEHEGEVVLLNDVPLQFGEKKKYVYRTVTKIPS